MEENFTITTLEVIPNMDIEQHLGLVSGSAITTTKRSTIQAIKASFKNIFGGEVADLDNTFNDTKSRALEDMKAQTIKLGGNTVINVRFESLRFDSNYCEVHVYGSAVKANMF